MKHGQDKIQEICNMLRRDTLDPAKIEAQEIIESANERAKGIIEEAEKEAQRQLESVRQTIEQERRVFLTSLEQAAVQGLEALRQQVEKSLFNKELCRMVEAEAAKPDLVAKLINAIVKAIDAGGLSSDISAVIPRTVSADEVNRLLVDGVLKKLRDGGVSVGNFAGGAMVQLRDKKMTIDITDEALRELLTSYIRKDFRKLIFAATS